MLLERENVVRKVVWYPRACAVFGASGASTRALYTVKFIIGGRVQKDVEQNLLMPSPTADSTSHSQKKRRSKGAEAVLFLLRTCKI